MGGEMNGKWGEKAWVDVFKMLGDSTRFAVVSALLEAGPDGMSVTDVAERVGAKITTVSAALRVLAKQEVVMFQRRGRVVSYFLRQSRVRWVMEVIRLLE